MTFNIDFPELFGWKSIPAAAIFAVLYAPLAAFFLFKIIHERRRVLITMTLFCLIRVTAFILRAVSIGVTSVGENEGVFIAAEVLFSVGFFGLLYSAYTLVVDRLELCDNVEHPIPIIGNILRFARNRRLFRIVLIIPVALGIAGIDITSSNPTSSTGIDLRKASAIIFLVLTILQVLQTLVLIRAEHQSTQKDPLENSQSSGLRARHISLLFGVIAVLLLIREIFSVATINDLAKTNNEHFWYPLVALPEWLCAVIYAIPGLIPPKVVNTKTELPQYTSGFRK
ncbi:hypothetical protein BDP27DRAFT_1331275 [Rhodocollybia butyracea]|uniref:Uncharacterized protein n=1 Tax=Rhodocollybia butyracea TaxID=206335 RepID=A0A9P5PIH0_9AGAR|nr:hypothetical protein BDP27DRAFT_1331275 [Rhodocollybia butyracea]